MARHKAPLMLVTGQGPSCGICSKAIPRRDMRRRLGRFRQLDAPLGTGRMRRMASMAFLMRKLTINLLPQQFSIVVTFFMREKTAVVLQAPRPGLWLVSNHHHLHVNEISKLRDARIMSNSSAISIGFLLGLAATLFWSELIRSELVSEAASAESDGRTISNETMQVFYPHSFRAGSPKYLERDFEAGADLICDQIRIAYREDICSKEEIGWN